MNDNPSTGRLLAQTCSCRPYQDNYDEVMKICEETGRKPAEVLRDAIDEWLLMRRAAATGADASPPDVPRSDLDGTSRPRSRIESIYDRIAGNDDYQRNDHNLRLIQFCVITVSAVATGFVNAFAHMERLGWIGATLLAVLITGFVEKFYFTLRHRLVTIYKSRKQRFAAKLCYRVIQATMILNATILCAWVAGVALPEFLQFWNRWSIAVHFALALVGVSAVRDHDAVAESRIRELKADAAREDIVMTRRAAVGDNPFLLFAAKLRGWLDGINLAFKLLRDKPELSASDVKQITGGPGGLYLTGGNDGSDRESDVTGISGKRWRR